MSNGMRKAVRANPPRRYSLLSVTGNPLPLVWVMLRDGPNRLVGWQGGAPGSYDKANQRHSLGCVRK